jgi:hypothetical protein
MYVTSQSRALRSCKRSSGSHIDGEATRLGGVAVICCMLGALGDLLIRVLLEGVDAGFGESLSDALITNVNNRADVERRLTCIKELKGGSVMLVLTA